MGYVQLDKSWRIIFLILNLSCVLQANYIYRVQSLIGLSSYVPLMKIAVPAAAISLSLNFIFVPIYGIVSSAIVSLLCGVFILISVDKAVE